MDRPEREKKKDVRGWHRSASLLDSWVGWWMNDAGP